MDILCARIRYIIPFMFHSEATYDKLVEEIAGQSEWNLQKMHEQKVEQDLYDMILNCFEMDGKQNNVGCSFEYCMQEENILEVNYTRFDRDFVVAVTQMGLYLFRTGVGFLWYEIKVPEDAAADEMILFQNEFKELSYERFVTRRTEDERYTFEKNGDTKTGVLMGHLISRLLERLPFTVTYFAEREDCLEEGKSIPDKAVLFNYIVMEGENEEQWWDYIYRITNGYNKRYMRKPDFADDIMEPFEHSYCYATSQGCGYYAVPDEGNHHFYTETLKKRVMFEYFLLEILSLYQFYSILKFTKNMENELSAERDKYLADSEEILSTLKNLSADINIFLVKSVYSSVSHISHQNDFYEYLLGRLRIRQNIEGLTIGLDSLQRLQEAREKERVQRIENLENEERELSDDRLNIGLGLISILALISAVADGYGAADVLVSLFHLPESMKAVISVILLILVAIIAVVAITSILPSINRTRRKRKQWKQNWKDKQKILRKL